MVSLNPGESLREGKSFMIQATQNKESRVRQGDILRDIDLIEYVAEEQGELEISAIRFPLVVVLSQDCDLEWDFQFKTSEPPRTTQDKWLLSVLVAPLYNAEHFYDGKHLSELRRTMRTVPRKGTEHAFLVNNQHPRYHFLQFSTDIPIVDSVVDFKHYFSVNVDTLKQLAPERFVCSVLQLYREDICHRFASYLSRIGLPEAL